MGYAYKYKSIRKEVIVSDLETLFCHYHGEN